MYCIYKKHMTQNSPSKSWVYTLNNYTENDCAALKALTVIRHRCCKEEGSTPHLQGAVTFERSYRLTQLKKLFPAAHWEVSKTKDPENYCIKGEIIIDTNNSKQGNRTDLSLGCELVCKEGNRALALKYPSTFVKYHKGLSLLKNILDEGNDWFETKTIIYWGESGSGKSRKVRKYCKDNNLRLYNVPEPINGSIWFDNYDDHEAILLDDFYGWIKYHTLLQVCDGYAMQMPVKGCFVQRKWTHVFITSNKPPNEWYPSRDEMVAFDRRVSTIEHLRLDCVL